MGMISLKNAPERRAWFKNSLREEGLHGPTSTSGADTIHGLPVHYFEAELDTEGGLIGCTRSHLRVYRQALQFLEKRAAAAKSEGKSQVAQERILHGCALVFEDDSRPTRALTPQLLQRCADLVGGSGSGGGGLWDVLRLHKTGLCKIHGKVTTLTGLQGDERGTDLHAEVYHTSSLCGRAYFVSAAMMRYSIAVADGRCELDQLPAAVDFGFLEQKDGKDLSMSKMATPDEATDGKGESKFLERSREVVTPWTYFVARASNRHLTLHMVPSPVVEGAFGSFNAKGFGKAKSSEGKDTDADAPQDFDHNRSSFNPITLLQWSLNYTTAIEQAVANFHWYTNVTSPLYTAASGFHMSAQGGASEVDCRLWSAARAHFGNAKVTSKAKEAPVIADRMRSVSELRAAEERCYEEIFDARTGLDTSDMRRTLLGDLGMQAAFRLGVKSLESQSVPAGKSNKQMTATCPPSSVSRTVPNAFALALQLVLAILFVEALSTGCSRALGAVIGDIGWFLYLQGLVDFSAQLRRVLLAANIALMFVYSFGSELVFRPPPSRSEEDDDSSSKSEGPGAKSWVRRVVTVWVVHFGWSFGVPLLINYLLSFVVGGPFSSGGHGIESFSVSALTVALLMQGFAVCLRFACMREYDDWRAEAETKAEGKESQLPKYDSSLQMLGMFKEESSAKAGSETNSSLQKKLRSAKINEAQVIEPNKDFKDLKNLKVHATGCNGYVRHPGFLGHILQTLANAVLLVPHLDGAMPAMHLLGTLLFLQLLVPTVLSFYVFDGSGWKEEQELLRNSDDGGDSVAEQYAVYANAVRNRFWPFGNYKRKLPFHLHVLQQASNSHQQHLERAATSLQDLLLAMPGIEYYHRIEAKVLKAASNIRSNTASDRHVFLWLAGALQYQKGGVHHLTREMMQDNPEVISQILRSPHKGTFVEEMIACPAWWPIRSIESVQHKESNQMRHTLVAILEHMGMDLTKSSSNVTTRVLGSSTTGLAMGAYGNDRIVDDWRAVLQQYVTANVDLMQDLSATDAVVPDVDCCALMKLTFRVLYHCLTGKLPSVDDTLYFDKTVVESVNAWKRMIAMKGVCPPQTKFNLVNIFRKSLLQATLECSSLGKGTPPLAGFNKAQLQKLSERLLGCAARIESSAKVRALLARSGNSKVNLKDYLKSLERRLDEAEAGLRDALDGFVAYEQVTVAGDAQNLVWRHVADANLSVGAIQQMAKRLGVVELATKLSESPATPPKRSATDQSAAGKQPRMLTAEFVSLLQKAGDANKTAEIIGAALRYAKSVEQHTRILDDLKQLGETVREEKQIGDALKAAAAKDSGSAGKAFVELWSITAFVDFGSLEEPYRDLGCLMQPMFISPIINFPDILVALKTLVTRHPQWVRRLRQLQVWDRLGANASSRQEASSKSGASVLADAIVLETIRCQHPFPILERLVAQPFTIDQANGKEKTQIPRGAQVFIEYDLCTEKGVENPLAAKWEEELQKLNEGERQALQKKLEVVHESTNGAQKAQGSDPQNQGLLDTLVDLPWLSATEVEVAQKAPAALFEPRRWLQVVSSGDVRLAIDEESKKENSANGEPSAKCPFSGKDAHSGSGAECPFAKVVKVLPEQTKFKSVPFGIGPRRCAGQHLARPWLSSVLNFVVQLEYEGWEKVHGEVCKAPAADKENQNPNRNLNVASIAEGESLYRPFVWRIFFPERNHLYSGRTNDDGAEQSISLSADAAASCISEVVKDEGTDLKYVVYRLVAALGESSLLGLRKLVGLEKADIEVGS